MQDKSKQSVWATDRQTDTEKRVMWGGAGGSWYSLCLWPQLPAATSKAPPTSAIARDCAGYKHRLWYGFQHRRRRRRRYLCAALRNFKRREQRNATVPFVLRGCQSTKINTVLCERESKWRRWNAMFGTTRDARSDDSSLQRRTDAVLKC